ncbi:DNA-binding transcriptional LysR family regulator [Catenulispora sp. GP43]|uniref:LysR family transcriptional regulator n=1 Tax=Catenulispora sp. GP43 TaxID=3156263 RepID=UPI00351123F0
MSDSSPPPADLDLRLVRYFTVVAEFGHFGRAAEELRVAQPSLSRQIRRLEQHVGARLLDRTPHGTRLTAAGEQFVPRARALLRLAAQAAAVARQAAEPSAITIGLLPNVDVAAAVRGFRSRHPEAAVRVVDLAWNEPREALLRRRVDVAVTRLPITARGLRVTPLYQEARALVVPRDHRLAARDAVTLDAFADEPLISLSDPAWNAFAHVDPRPDGSRPLDGPRVEVLEDTLELIAAGQAVAILPAGLAGARPDLVAIPVLDADPVRVVLVTRAGEDNRLVADFQAQAVTGASAAIDSESNNS